MLASFLSNVEVAKVVERIRGVLSADWLSVTDVMTLFKLCVAETSTHAQSR